MWMSAEIFQLGHEAGIKCSEVPQKLCVLLWPLQLQLSAPTAGPPFPRAELPEFRLLLGKVRRSLFLPAANTSEAGGSRAGGSRGMCQHKGSDWNYPDNTFQSSFCNRL